MSYTYDTKGNILSVSDGTHTITYEYDALNELTWEKNGVEGKAWKNSYDLGGNILSKTEYSYQNGTVGSTPLSTVTYTYGDANWPDLLTSYNGSSITYDAIGNPLSYRGWNFTWQGGRQLAAASDGTTSLSFVYNESGLRTEKTVGSDSHRYVYRGSTLVAEITGDYALYFHHDARSEIVGFTYASGNTQTEYFYRKNLQGDVIGIVDSAGASVAAYRYDAWGQILDASGTMASVNPIRYRGYYYDGESGFYYLQSRYYDPAIGRFINADVLVSPGQGSLGCNMFAYCGNDPVNASDSNGEVPQWLKDAVRWLATEVAKPTIKYFQSELEQIDLTVSIGFNSSGSPSFWSFNGQIGASFDTKGNFAMQYQTMGGVTNGTPSFSGSVYGAITCAPSIYALEGDSCQMGGSIAAPVDGIPAYVGGDFLLIPTERGLRYGIQGNIGCGTPGAEVHVEWGTTTTKPGSQFNIFSEAARIYRAIIKWSEN